MSDRSAVIVPPQHGEHLPEPPAPSTGRAATFAVGGTMTMMALTVLASATNYASNLIFSRLLTPESFGDLTALLAVVVIVTVPAGAAQTIGAERVAGLIAAGDESRVNVLVRYVIAHVTVISLATGLAAAVAAPLVYTVLDLQAIGAALALAPLLAVSFFIPVIWGLLQGFDRFLALGCLMLIAAVSRIAFGAPWAAIGGGAGGALAGQAIGNTFAVAVTLWLLRTHIIGPGTGAASAGARRVPNARSISASMAFVAFALLSNLDVVLAKLFLSSAEAGEYAVLATIGKIVIFLPSAISVVMVPGIARARANDAETATVLRRGGFIVIGTTLLAAVPILLFPDFVVHSMFGANYAGAASGVRAMAMSGIALGVLYLLVVYTVAIQDRRWIFVLCGGVVLQVGLISWQHDNATVIATMQGIAVFAALAVNELLFHPFLRAERWVLGKPWRRGTL